MRMSMRAHAACSKCHHPCPTAPTIPASSPGHLILLPQDLKRNLHICLHVICLRCMNRLDRPPAAISIYIYIYIYKSEIRPNHIYPSPRQPSLSIPLMASLLNKLSLVFLLFFASSSLGIHARSESRFFMTTTRPEDTKEVPTTPPVQGLSGSGYGLYGHGQEQFAPATTTNYNNNNYYNNNARPNANTFPSSFPDAKLTSESYDNGGYNYGNHFNNANNSPSKFSNEEFNTRSYETKEDGNYVDSKQYGMSDTRLFENGRYFYDVNAERKRNQYRTYPTRGTPEAGARGGNYGNGVYGNGNAYKYNNAMEYQNNQEEYVP